MGRSDPMIDRIMGITRVGNKQVEPTKVKDYKPGLVLQCFHCDAVYILREPQGSIPDNPADVPREYQQYSLQIVPGCLQCRRGNLRWYIIFGGPLPGNLNERGSRAQIADAVMEMLHAKKEAEG